MKKILAILGDYYHKEDLLKEVLDHSLKRISIRVEYIRVDQLMEKLQEQPDAVILSKSNKVNPKERKGEYWMDENLEKQIHQYVQCGGGWFVWHSGLSSYGHLRDYYSMVKGKFDFHPSENLNVTYCVNESFKVVPYEKISYQVVDEHYFVTCEESKTYVFLHANSSKGTSAAGWKHGYGKGRVVCLTPSHTKEGLLNPEFNKLLIMSLKWCLGD